MPVKFHGHSEYDRNYKWRDSFKSASYIPSKDVAATEAGQASTMAGSDSLESHGHVSLLTLLSYQQEHFIHDTHNGGTATEYQMKYGLTDENNSPLMQADRQGVKSVQQGYSVEPPLQTKKRIGGLARTDPIGFRDTDSVVDDGYVLLGRQGKFADNVKYRSKSMERPKSKKEASRNIPQQQQQQKQQQQHHQQKQQYSQKNQPSQQNGVINGATNGYHHHHADPRATPDAPRKEKRSPPPPPPRPVYDTGAPKYHKARMATPKPEQIVPAGKPTGVNQRPKRADRQKEAKKEEKRTAVIPAKAQKAQREDGQKKEVENKRKGQMNEFVQTNVQKGVVDSGQEAPSDYAMKYKSGVAAPRARGPKRMSEYALQFTWKKGLAASPLLAAEQIVYKNNPAVPPASKAPMPRSSEYNAAFKPWQMIKSTPNLAEAFQDDQASEITPAKKAKLKRSRSVEDVSELPPAGVEPVTSEEDKRLVMGSLNPQRLHFPHGKLRRYNSTYSTNYKAPTNFSYEQGTWKGAAPAHAEAHSEPQRASSAADDEGPGSWFSEVMELRKKADEYKHRALGTHFSRTHVGQLFAQQADLWDTVSNSEQLSALDLSHSEGASARSHTARSERSTRASGSSSSVHSTNVLENMAPTNIHIKKSHTASNKADKSNTCNHANPRIERLQLPNDDDDDNVPRKESMLSGSSRTAPSTARTESTLQPENGYDHAYYDDDEDDEGRIPTPQLRNKGSAANGGHRAGGRKSRSRHHLARTTPMVGGALLTSPPPAVSRGQDARRRQQQQQQHQAWGSDDDDTTEQGSTYRPIAGQKTHKATPAQSAPSRELRAPSVQESEESRIPLGKTVSAPIVMSSNQPTGPTQTFGMPTRDSHPLIDEVASTDTPLRTQFVHSPAKQQQNKTAKRMSTQKAMPPTIKEGMAETFTKPQTRKDTWMQVDLDGPSAADDDVLSMSARSVASSCSLASEVLERAKNRRDEFWRN